MIHYRFFHRLLGFRAAGVALYFRAAGNLVYLPDFGNGNRRLTNTDAFGCGGQLRGHQSRSGVKDSEIKSGCRFGPSDSLTISSACKKTTK